MQNLKGESAKVSQTDFILQRILCFSDVIKADKDRILMKKDPQIYVSNPLNAFLLIKRLSFDVIQKINDVVEISNAFNEKTKNIQLSIHEFDGAVDGLIRLQIMYELKPEDLAKGIIEDQKYRDDLTANELFALGSVLIKLQQISLALSYLNLALDKNKQQQEMSDVMILENILDIHNKNGDKKLVIETLNKILKIAPNRVDLQKIRDDMELNEIFEEKDLPKAKSVMPSVEKNGSYSAFKELKILIEACGGRQKKNISETSKFRCRYVSKTSFSKIAPFKVEEVNLEPYIAIYHEVISDDEIKIFKEFSKASLNRATVLNLDNTHKVFFDFICSTF